ncbi:hypothetical protein ColKHC_12656 [Colletotrichum higginsianum]|nr:hypothetical protein ColKHC_12656 [Colletotrichum higginsianum]
MPQVQGFVEPRYDQVPIPQGYAAVHGEGGVAPSPYAISRASPPGATGTALEPAFGCAKAPFRGVTVQPAQLHRVAWATFTPRL